MKTCPKCRSEWPDSARFCPKDGTPMGDAVVVEEDVAQEQPEEIEEIKKQPTQDVPDLTPEEEEKLDQQRLQGFSETQWFMLAQDPDKLKDAASTEDLFEMQDDYDWDDEISEEERSKFSLRGKKK